MHTVRIRVVRMNRSTYARCANMAAVPKKAECTTVNAKQTQCGANSSEKFWYTAREAPKHTLLK